MPNAHRLSGGGETTTDLRLQHRAGQLRCPPVRLQPLVRPHLRIFQALPLIGFVREVDELGHTFKNIVSPQGSVNQLVED
jgi:hypothetical protein